MDDRECRIVLTGADKASLNEKIDIKLKEDYLLFGGMYVDDDDTLSQVMTTPHNIDNEFTLAGGIKLGIFVVVYAVALFYIL